MIDITPILVILALVGGVFGLLWRVFFPRPPKADKPGATIQSGGPGTTPPPPEEDR
jgi:hypothetical protein